MIGNSILLENIKNVYRKISSAAIRAGRNPFDVKLVAATKTIPIPKMQEAMELGLRAFGENRVQEAKEKIMYFRQHMPDYVLEWHLIGHLQTNKTKTAVQLFDLIHSVDSVALAQEIDRHAGRLGKIQRVLLQVRLSEEESKHGVPEASLPELIQAVSAMKHLKVEGLMTIPPFFDEPENVMPYFRKMKELRDKAEAGQLKLPELSMGMTHDFELAILEGATIVRIGTGIFGTRAKREEDDHI